MRNAILGFVSHNGEQPFHLLSAGFAFAERFMAGILAEISPRDEKAASSDFNRTMRNYAWNLCPRRGWKSRLTSSTFYRVNGSTQRDWNKNVARRWRSRRIASSCPLAFQFRRVSWLWKIYLTFGKNWKITVCTGGGVSTPIFGMIVIPVGNRQ